MIRATKHASISLKQLIQQDQKRESPRESAGSTPIFSSIEMRFIKKEEENFRQYSNPWGDQIRDKFSHIAVGSSLDEPPELEEAENVSSKLLAHSQKVHIVKPNNLAEQQQFTGT